MKHLIEYCWLSFIDFKFILVCTTCIKIYDRSKFLFWSVDSIAILKITVYTLTIKFVMFNNKNFY